MIAGTAWHWVDPVAGAAKAAQVLRPGGLLAPFHHVFQTPPGVLDALATAYQQVAPDSPVNLQALGRALDAYQPLFTKIADGIRETGGFSEPEQWQFDWERTYTRDQWLDQVPTHGHLNLLPPDKLATVLQSVGTAIDAMGGSFTMPYTTEGPVSELRDDLEALPPEPARFVAVGHPYADLGSGGIPDHTAVRHAERRVRRVGPGGAGIRIHAHMMNQRSRARSGVLTRFYPAGSVIVPWATIVAWPPTMTSVIWPSSLRAVPSSALGRPMATPWSMRKW